MQNTTTSLLLDFERRAFSEHYAKYFEVKRNNFFATIQSFPDQWKCFMLLDDLLMREFEDLNHQHDPNVALPLNLFMHAHALFRIALEHAFSGSLNECWNIFRMSIESTYQGCLILKKPELALTWRRKADRTKETRDDFNRAFRFNRAESFELLGLERLHQVWEWFSEWGHTNIDALSTRFEYELGPNRAEIQVHYFETKPERLGLSIMHLLQATHELEKALFFRFDDRLKLDFVLGSRRQEFVNAAESARIGLFRRFPELIPSSPSAPS